MMKLTKYIHACVLVEDDEHTALFDPGLFAWESDQFSIEKIEKLDYILITHEHFDHFHLPFVQALVVRFPNVRIITTEAVVAQLREAGIQNATEEPDENVKVTYLAHASMAPLDTNPPQNIRIDYKDKVTHPGDSLDFKDTKEILLLPLAGPWGSAAEAIRRADELRPEVVVPIHDWMWNEQWRTSMYERMEHYFAAQNIQFMSAQNGKTFRVY
jgi:L-ascorbate metabolism protein UlaG (beta-lactamase superfamily)